MEWSHKHINSVQWTAAGNLKIVERNITWSLELLLDSRCFCKITKHSKELVGQEKR
jgi:hypothetical protein